MIIPKQSKQSTLDRVTVFLMRKIDPGSLGFWNSDSNGVYWGIDNGRIVHSYSHALDAFV